MECPGLRSPNNATSLPAHPSILFSLSQSSLAVKNTVSTGLCLLQSELSLFLICIFCSLTSHSGSIVTCQGQYQGRAWDRIAVIRALWSTRHPLLPYNLIGEIDRIRLKSLGQQIPSETSSIPSLTAQVVPSFDTLYYTRCNINPTILSSRVGGQLTLHINCITNTEFISREKARGSVFLLFRWPLVHQFTTKSATLDLPKWPPRNTILLLRTLTHRMRRTS